jgi:hypothetical protein
MGSAMAKPKKKEERDETTELEWDVAREPQEKALPDIIDVESEAAAETPDENVAPGPVPEAARPQTARRRKPRPLPVVSYAVMFVVVALTTAALLIVFT